MDPDETTSPTQARRLLERYGGHLVLLAIALLLFAGARATVLAGVFDYDLVVEPAAAGDTAVETPQVVETREALPAPIDLSDVPVQTDSSLYPVLNPLTYEGPRPAHTNLISYTVVRNDTPFDLALRFEIDEATLLGCNPQLSEESSLMRVGDVLIICPEDGVLHDVRQGDSLESIAALYAIPEEDIIAYAPNNLEFPYRLYPETQVFVPGAVREVFVWTPPDPPRNAGSSSASGSAYADLGTRTYIWPVVGRNISQYYSYFHQGLDIALPSGNAVYASDTGTVSYAGWNSTGYGYLVVINHGRGISTYYAHLSNIYVYVGQVVGQGDVVAASGNTGNSSGPHIHFEIRLDNGATRVNPLWAGYLN